VPVRHHCGFCQRRGSPVRSGRPKQDHNDLAFALGAPRNPHQFLTNIAVPGIAQLSALQGQAQIAAFFASDGMSTIDPDGAGPLFEVPVGLPLPETLNYLP